MKNSENEGTGNSVLQEGLVRIITQGQELTTDSDEKTLGDMGFKDNQVMN